MLMAAVTFLLFCDRSQCFKDAQELSVMNDLYSPTKVILLLFTKRKTERGLEEQIEIQESKQIWRCI